MYPRAARFACWRGFSSTQGADVFPIPGTKLASRAEENAKTAEVVLRLTLEDLAEIEASVTQPTIIMEDRYSGICIYVLCVCAEMGFYTLILLHIRNGLSLIMQYG